MACAAEVPWTDWGNAATSSVATPPPASTTRPRHRAGPSPAAVMTWQAPNPNSADVIIQRSVAPWAARALIVSRIGS
jgi:hypothetical protein